MHLLHLIISLGYVYGEQGQIWKDLPGPVGIEDQHIADVNKYLNLPDGDIMRDIGNQRSTINDEFYRWKLPIPVVLSSQANLKTRGEFKEAKKEYELRTCIEFKDWEGEPDYISIYPMSGCWSYVGQVYPNQQNISIQQPGCDWSATIQHELMHALGIYHEQSRPDRTDYVFIDEKEVQDGKLNNFNRYDFKYVSPVGTEYAYDSIMHYGPFSFNKNDKPTIVPRIAYFLDVIGQRKTFSTLDATRINAIYDCADPLRKTMNCNFNLMNICGFVNENDFEDKWTHYDVNEGQTIGGTFAVEKNAGLPTVDASAHVTDSGRFIYVEGLGSLVSRVLDHTYSQDQCLVIWTYFGGAGSLDIEIWSVDPDYGDLDENVERFTIARTEADTKWNFNNFNVRPGVGQFKLRLVANSDGFVAVDDISVQEAECRHNTFIIDDYPDRLANAQVAVKEALEANQTAEILNLEENLYWSPKMVAKSGHVFQVRVNFVGHNNYNGKDYSQYSSAYLYLVPDEKNNEQLFWPWSDQLFKFYVRDQNPSVLERMDTQASVVTKDDGKWERPGEEPVGGVGRYSFIKHFDLLINQHGYFTKHNNLIFQVTTENMRNESNSSLLDDCEPCYGPRKGERVCKMDSKTGKSYCGCSDPMILKDNECHCPPGYIYDRSQTLRLVCQDVCQLDYCRVGEECIHTEDGAKCIDPQKPTEEPVTDGSLTIAAQTILLLAILFY